MNGYTDMKLKMLPSFLLLAGCLLLCTNGAAGSASGTLPLPATSFMPGGIPRLIHHFYYDGEEALMNKTRGKDALFQRHWIESWKVHHRHWRFIFWDVQMVELLLSTMYPWYLPIYNSMTEDSHIIRKCDAARPFILHAYGGVYADADTECFRSIEPSIMDYSLVYGEEEGAWINNGQVATAPGHPFLQRLLNRARAVGSQHGIGLMNALGPAGTTDEMREYFKQCGLGEYAAGEHQDVAWQQALDRMKSRNDQRMHVLAHRPDPMFRIYTKGVWLSACSWNDRQCLAESLACRGVIRSLSFCQQYEDRMPACHQQEPQLLLDQLCHWYEKEMQALPWSHKSASNIPPVGWRDSHVVQCIQYFGRLAGQHLFAGSWRDDAFSHAKNSSKKAAEGTIELWQDKQYFIEALPRGSCEMSPLTATRSDWVHRALWPLEEVLPAAVVQAPAGCTVLSLAFFPELNGEPVMCCAGTCSQATLHDVLKLGMWAKQQRCRLSVLTNAAQQVATLLDTEHVQGDVVTWDLKVEATTAEGEVSTNVPQMLYTWLHNNPGAKVHALHMALPGISGWATLRHLHTQGSYVLRTFHAPVLLVELGALPRQYQAWADNAYNHIYQELDYMGHAHLKLSDEQNSKRLPGAGPCVDCTASNIDQKDGICTQSEDTVLPSLLLGFVKTGAVYHPHSAVMHSASADALVRPAMRRHVHRRTSEARARAPWQQQHPVCIVRN